METANITVETNTEIEVFDSYVTGKHATSYTAGEVEQNVRIELLIHRNSKGLYPVNLDIDTFTYLDGTIANQRHDGAKLLSHQQFTLEQLEMLQETLAKFIAGVKSGKFTK